MQCSPTSRSRGRIDTEIDTLALVDPTETGDPVLDDFLEEIASEKAERNTQFWIERLAPRSEAIVETTLDQLVEGGILKQSLRRVLVPVAERLESGLVRRRPGRRNG